MIQYPPTAALLLYVQHAASMAFYGIDAIIDDSRLPAETSGQLNAAFKAVASIQDHLGRVYELGFDGLEAKGARNE